MKIVIQRVNYGTVKVDDKMIGQIGKGFVIFLGVADGDTKEMVDKYVDKMAKLRIFPDASGKTNLSLKDVDGEVLVISQFTLYADCRKGNRPSFIKAGSPEEARNLYEYFIDQCKVRFGRVQCGSFGADMKVQLENDGPFTILWDSSEW
ncbi:MAG: D-aminoacyl-tRNA deacylase [Lachnospiraceae bacterium]